jgi:hypothetical protein
LDSQPFGDALLTLIGKVASRNPTIDLEALRDCTRDRLKQTSKAIESAAKSDMGAKARLQLEADMARLVAELDALQALVALLVAATQYTPTELELDGLWAESISKMAPSSNKQPGLVHVATSASPNSSPWEGSVHADASVVSPLIALAIGSLANLGVKNILTTPSLVTSGVIITCSELINGNAVMTPCLPPRILEPSLGVACRAAALVGISFSVDPVARKAILDFASASGMPPVLRTT